MQHSSVSSVMVNVSPEYYKDERLANKSFVLIAVTIFTVEILSKKNEHS